MRRRIEDLRRARLGLVSPPPVVLETTFRSGFAGGGGQASTDVSPFDSGLVLAGTDTGGIRVSRDGLATSIVHSLGFDEMRTRQTDGVKWSRLSEGRGFMCSGDGGAGVGGVYAANDLDTTTPGKWVRLDGIAGPELILDGGNNEAGAQYPAATYPRHYGRPLEIDETTLAGFTFVHVATTLDGFWRIKVDNATLVPTEQFQYPGTAGTYGRCVQLATYAPNEAGNDYSRIILSVYHNGTPVKPRLCTVANDTSGSAAALVSTTMSDASVPTNVEAMGYIKTSAGQAVTVFCSANDVKFSTNAFTAAAASITMTSVARTEAQADGPENTTTWFSVGTTHTGTTYVVLVGTFGGRGSGSSWNTVWRGTWAQASTTPWSAVTWTALAGSTYWSEQIMNRPGAANEWWLSGSNTPGMNGTAAVSAFTTSKTDPARMYLVSRGNAYRSDNHGLNWYSSRVWGSADHSSITFWDAFDTQMFTTTCGDWTLACSRDSFATEPDGVLHTYNTNCNFPNPKNGKLYIGGGDGGATVAPPADPGNTLYSIPYTQLATVSSNPGVMTDLNLDTGGGVGGVVGLPMGGCSIYGNGGAGTVEAIIVGTQGAKGMWYTKNNGTTWVKVLAAVGAVQPFSGSGFGNAPVVPDRPRNVVYLADRTTGRVWRVSVATDGTVSTAVQLFADTWTYNVVKDGVFYIDLDQANDRLWVSSPNGVWYINGASMAPNNTAKANATATPAATQYPGEIWGTMCFLPTSGAVYATTMGFTSAGKQKYVTTLNGADGPRALFVPNPTVGANWNLGTAVDWTVTRDRGRRTGYIAPHGIARNWNGTMIAETMQGNGVGLWEV